MIDWKGSIEEKHRRMKM
jgi:hypothetical protein